MTDLNWLGGIKMLWNVSAVLGTLWLIFTGRWWTILAALVVGTVLGLAAVWWRRSNPPCTHPFVRCVHGDEINQANGARVACLGCQQYLHSRRVLEICTFTGTRHGFEDDWADEDGRQ